MSETGAAQALPIERPGEKRKNPPPGSNSVAKRQKMFDARRINVQSANEAFGNGELNVNKFIRAREFEIKALEDSMLHSKKMLSTRSFQAVPRELRRRTASHNVKRVPKRLRKRARLEMLQDNTPRHKKKRPKGREYLRVNTIKRLQNLRGRAKERERLIKTKFLPDQAKAAKRAGGNGDSVEIRAPRIKKNQLRPPPLPAAKFRKRQIDKTWLPTHLFHAKRAHMTQPKEPLWRFALPLTPTQKTYRLTHRASGMRGAVAWDASFMSTIGLEGREDSLCGLLKALGVGAGAKSEMFWLKSCAKWKRGSRIWEGWLHERQEWPHRPIAPAVVIWNPGKVGNSRPEDLEGSEVMEMDAQVEKKPSRRQIFVRVHPGAFMQVWEQVLRLAKVQKPSIMVQDLRFDIGSIEITGPGSSEALVGVLNSRRKAEESPFAPTEVDELWPKLQTLSNPSLLPKGIVLGLDIIDPRLRYPPRMPRASNFSGAEDALFELAVHWPLDTTPQTMSLFSGSSRFNASVRLSTQKSIDRRRRIFRESNSANAGQYPPAKSSDSPIPTILLTSASSSAAANQSSWTVLIPWKCVRPVWTSLMHYPLSTGGNPRFGGLTESRQIAFAAGRPWFPADFPGTRAGWEWEIWERGTEKRKWEQKPKGRRIEYSRLDLGRGRRGEVGDGWACDWEALLKANGILNDAWEYDLKKANVPVWQAPMTWTMPMLSSKDSAEQHAGEEAGTKTTLPLAAVKITMIGRGVPQTRARIYRLPQKDPHLREKWLEMLPGNPSSRPRPRHLFQRQPAPGDADYPPVPDVEDLIGYVTTGNFNLAEGKGIGVGSVLLMKVRDQTNSQETMPERRSSWNTERNICVVRDAGETVGRLARWELVS